jgi:hypothetical protein
VARGPSHPSMAPRKPPCNSISQKRRQSEAVVHSPPAPENNFAFWARFRAPGTRSRAEGAAPLLSSPGTGRQACPVDWELKPRFAFDAGFSRAW